MLLVTGCAGFIGSHLTEKLLEKGYKVLGIDSFTDYYSREIKEKNLSNFKNHPNFKFLEKDVRNLAKKDMEGADGIFHLAAQAGVRKSFGINFKGYVDNNISATQQLFEAAKDMKIKKLVFASSSSVYGNAHVLPANEDLPLRPISPYGLTKLFCENLIQIYRKYYKTPNIILRYFTVYGPRQRPDMGIYKFIDSILNGKTITIYGDGEQTRDFTYVSDIVDATLASMECKIENAILNIGGGSRIKLKDVIKLLSEQTGKTPKIEHQEKQKGDVQDTLADISKARKLIGYRPEVSFKTGLSKEIEWFRTQ